jgi:O-antigen/teichoic acid export membrane protein
MSMTWNARDPLLSTKQLSKNILWSFLGTGLPLLVAIFAIPLLIEQLGALRFGVLSIAWMVVGYFSLFDLGLGRALTQLVAESIGKGDERQIPALVWAATGLMIGLGAVGALFVSAVSRWLVDSKLEIPADLAPETLTSFYLLAASIPIVIVTTALRGILEARQRFGLVNAVRVPLGMMTYLGPLAALAYSNTLPAMVLMLVLARALSCAAYLAICLKLYPDLARRQPLRPDLMRRLLSFGGWMTMSNIAAPLLLYLGRLLIALLISAQAVAYFSAPYDVVINLLIVPGVLVSVFFPSFAELFRRNRKAVGSLYRKGMTLNLVAILPLAAATYFFAEVGLAWWINEEFSTNGYRVAQFLAIGVFINSFGHLSQALVQAYGRPDLTAKLHVAELVLYVPYLWFLVERYGIEGAALAWVIRVAISTVVLWAMASKCIGGSVAKRYAESI